HDDRRRDCRRGDRVGRSRRGNRVGRDSRAMGVAGAAVAALSLLVLSGCSGAADAAPTVGPTAGATEAAEPTEYEPTLPPYTTEVDLSAEDEAEVEELLLLIDEFSTLTATLDGQSTEAVASMKGRVDSQMLDEYMDGMRGAYDDGKRTSGAIVSTSTVVLDFDANEAVIATCYDFSDYTVYESDNPDEHLYPDRPT